MGDAHSELDFLTRSENRVTVLGLLASDSYAERALVEATDISQTTVRRVLEDFTERGWVTESEEGYTTTAFGDLLAADYERLAASMELSRRLAPYRHLLPVEEMDFDLRLLTDATVTDPERLDTLQSVDRWSELIRRSDRVRFVANTGNELIVRVMRDQVVDHDTEHESVFTPELYEYVRSHSRLREMHREMLRHGARFHRAPAETEQSWFLALYDDRIGVGGFDETGTIKTGFEADAAPVVEWAEDTFESYRARATELTLEDFTE